MADEPHAPCAICAGPVLRRKGEARFKWRVRRSCGELCRKRLQGRRIVTNLPPKECVICDAEFTCRDDEAPRNFMKRQTCGNDECYSKLMSQKTGRHQPCDPVKWHIEKWPVDYAGGFGRASIDPGDKRGAIPLRPATHVAKESSIS